MSLNIFIGCAGQSKHNLTGRYSPLSTMKQPRQKTLMMPYMNVGLKKPILSVTIQHSTGRFGSFLRRTRYAVCVKNWFNLQVVNVFLACLTQPLPTLSSNCCFYWLLLVVLLWKALQLLSSTQFLPAAWARPRCIVRYRRNGFLGLLLLLSSLSKSSRMVSFSPNAYVRSTLECLDFFILAGLIVNLTTTLIFVGGLSRLTRALKALRALRLITLIDKMRNTFQSLIISGAIRILDAAVLAILYMIPYAVWGLNIFAGKMNECNDQNVNGLAQCNNEFTNTVVNNSFGFLVPRVWNNPAPSTTFSFDTFRSSLLILFEIVSLEGWIDVMGIATSITGENSQPQTNASQVNAIFFVIYNLLGGVVILTLFVRQVQYIACNALVWL